MNEIENDNQLQITEKWIKDFKESLESVKKEGGSMNKQLYELSIKATESMIADLEEQIKVYHKENTWIDARFGDHWIEHAMKNYDQKDLAEIALRNGRARIKLFETMKEVVNLLNPNNPKESVARKIAVDAIQKDTKTDI